MASSSVAELQQKLFKRIGIDTPAPARSQRGAARGGKRPTTRKDQRRAQRVEKRSNRYGGRHASESRIQGDRNPPARLPTKQTVFSRPPTPKSIAKKFPWVPDDDSVSENTSDGADDLGLGESGDFDDPDHAIAADNEPKLKKKISKSMQEKFDQDDAEIEAFERKLGLKKGRKSLPQSFKEDGLGELLGDVEAAGSENDGDADEQKRKRDYDDWLSSKRRKTIIGAPSIRKPTNQQSEYDDDDVADDLDSDSDLLMPYDVSMGENEEGGSPEDDSFAGFDSDGSGEGEEEEEEEEEEEQEEAKGEEHSTVARKKENPYVAPTTGNVVARYVPPSLRKAAGTESEQRARLQKNVQGLVNRLTDANILSIVQSIEELYQKNARGEVTEIITDIVLAQIYKPELLPDQFFVLTGGFTAAIYKIIGSSFGSHLLRRLVEDLARDYRKAGHGDADTRREASNLVNFLTQLYVFEVVSCKIIFDYMERFLTELSEVNVELLLRICRMAGRMLRRDDAQALKHIASVLNTNMSNGGYENVSVRTKFMVETINDLKNSKPKGKGLDSAVVSEHVVRMKKRIGELKSQSRRLDGLAPMGMSLRDIEGADTDGKWWLVGASVPVKTKDLMAKETEEESDQSMTDDEDMDFVLPDYPQKARSQGFGTTAQIAIFTALMSATNFEHGYRQFVNLKLKKDDQLEIARVLVQCVGSEVEYTEFYALVANQACSNNKLRFAFQDRLWKIFRGLGESMFGDDADDEETADSERMKDPRRLANVARFYASLVADGALGIAIMKPLELPEVNNWTADFVEYFLVQLLAYCKGEKSSDEDVKVEKIFGAARQLPAVAAGLHWFLRKKVRKSKLKEAKKMDRVREKAQTAVQAVEVA
ncbi:Armadillo-type fold domain containing protein [Cordyceps fumosorosea ARSEF 2679]|uniref:Armadillo-type fold domain containing protein n=1 Tax=Cordyceps fumosorosea (strain ARSEF 2679) TaxID=1081104 RepID=A0A168EGK3_CORFA|nr:Armadillo-type fold domain containing protein [Cordyceps fumosorosea ARSEF 2679]OAA73781.1 Armadillo-type fold domain containing protein [Cordyceps fumosorosea ARSEF 2679]